MARAFYQLITTANNLQDGIFQPDEFQSPFNLSYAVVVPPGVTASFLLQYTLASVDTQGQAQTTQPHPDWIPIWLPDPTNGTLKTQTVGGNYGWPIRALRVNVSSLSGSFLQTNGFPLTAIRFEVLQGMSSR